MLIVGLDLQRQHWRAGGAVQTIRVIVYKRISGLYHAYPFRFSEAAASGIIVYCP